MENARDILGYPSRPSYGWLLQRCGLQKIARAPTCSFPISWILTYTSMSAAWGPL